MILWSSFPQCRVNGGLLTLHTRRREQDQQRCSELFNETVVVTACSKCSSDCDLMGLTSPLEISSSMSGLAIGNCLANEFQCLMAYDVGQWSDW